MKLRSVFVFCVMLLMLIATTVTVGASGSQEISMPLGLNLCYYYDDIPVSGAVFDLFKVADYDYYGNFVVVEDFEEYSEDILAYVNGDTNESLAQMLCDNALPVTSQEEGQTDAEGKVRFPVGEASLSTGLYLVTGDKLELDGYVYEASPVLVMLPSYDGDRGESIYDVTINVKCQRSPLLSDYKVIKIWDDECHQSQRPESITVQLLCNGKPYGDAVTLPNNGKWEYTWTNLDTSYEWAVSEFSVKGYEKPEIKQNGTTFTITNKCNKDEPPTETGDRLPQTGLLWWPVILLVLVGVVLLVVGINRKRNS